MTLTTLLDHPALIVTADNGGRITVMLRQCADPETYAGVCAVLVPAPAAHENAHPHIVIDTTPHGVTVRRDHATAFEDETPAVLIRNEAGHLTADLWEWLAGDAAPLHSMPLEIEDTPTP